MLVRLPEETHRKLRHYCVDHDLSVAEVIRLLVEDFLRAEKKPKKR